MRQSILSAESNTGDRVSGACVCGGNLHNEEADDACRRRVAVVRSENLAVGVNVALTPTPTRRGPFCPSSL